MLYKAALAFESVDNIPKCDHSKHFPVVLLFILDKVVLTFDSVDEILKWTIQMKAIEQYFPMVLFIMLYKVEKLLSLWLKS